MACENDFEVLTEFGPLFWQIRLFEEYFAEGKIPSSVDIPTGLGKTAVMALWLIARARHKDKALPRRLVYVVDRHAVVDQATDFELKLRERLDDENKVADSLKADLDLTGCSLPISTLWGQHIDNWEWQEDPGTLAIVVGTVDMIGSWLLFEGYGVSRKIRPYMPGCWAWIRWSCWMNPTWSRPSRASSRLSREIPASPARVTKTTMNLPHHSKFQHSGGYPCRRRDASVQAAFSSWTTQTTKSLT